VAANVAIGTCVISIRGVRIVNVGPCLIATSSQIGNDWTTDGLIATTSPIWAT
jgi:hypothetical protein